MKTGLQYLGSFLGLWLLFQGGIWLGGGEYLKFLPPIAYLVLFAGGILRIFAGTVMLACEAILHYLDKSHYLEARGDYVMRSRTILEATLASACLAAASVLADTQTRSWVFCMYAVAAYVLLGIGDEAIKKIQPSKRESS